MEKEKGELSYEELKKSGYIIQEEPEYFTVRLHVSGGFLKSEQLEAIGRIAAKYGRGEVHITTRQGLQIPYVKYYRLGDITKELERIGVPPGSCGPRVRNIIACPGKPECPNANINTKELAGKIDERYFARDLPTKLKIAVSGCPNSCAKSQVNDVGVIGVVEPAIIKERCTGCGLCVRACKEAAIKLVNGVAEIDYKRCIYCGDCIRVCPEDADVAKRKGLAIYVGGNIGRHPQLGRKLVDFANEQTLFQIIDKSMTLFEEQGLPKERFGHFINRIGIGPFSTRVLEGEP